jgi:tetratricopeptide (TPR) repeat protein
MNNLLPITYLTILILVLSILTFVLIKQISDKKNIENQLYNLQAKVRSKTADPSDYYSLGVIYLSKKLFDQAIIQFSYALNTWDKQDSKGIANLYNTIGFTYFESGQYDLSIYYYTEAINQLPDYIVALNNLAYSYEKKKMTEKAIETYKQVLLLDSENEVAKNKIEILSRRLRTRDDRI